MTEEYTTLYMMVPKTGFYGWKSRTLVFKNKETAEKHCWVGHVIVEVTV